MLCTNLRSNSQECKIVGRVQLFKHGLGLVVKRGYWRFFLLKMPDLIHQVVEEAAVLDGGGIVQGRLDWNTVGVDHDRPNDAFVSYKTLESLLNLGCHYLQLLELDYIKFSHI